MKNPFAWFFRKVFGRSHTPSVPPKPPLSPEQFREMLIEALEDSETGRLMRKRVVGFAPSVPGASDPAVNTSGGTPGYLPVFTASDNIENSVAFQTAGKVGIGTPAPSYKLQVEGDQMLESSAGVTARLVLNQAGIQTWYIDNNADTGSLSFTSSIAGGKVGIGTAALPRSR